MDKTIKTLLAPKKVSKRRDNTDFTRDIGLFLVGFYWIQVLVCKSFPRYKPGLIIPPIIPVSDPIASPDPTQPPQEIADETPLPSLPPSPVGYTVKDAVGSTAAISLGLAAVIALYNRMHFINGIPMPGARNFQGEAGEGNRQEMIDEANKIIDELKSSPKAERKTELGDNPPAPQKFTPKRDFILKVDPQPIKPFDIGRMRGISERAEIIAPIELQPPQIEPQPEVEEQPAEPLIGNTQEYHNTMRRLMNIVNQTTTATGRNNLLTRALNSLAKYLNTESDEKPYEMPPQQIFILIILNNMNLLESFIDPRLLTAIYQNHSIDLPFTTRAAAARIVKRDLIKYCNHFKVNMNASAHDEGYAKFIEYFRSTIDANISAIIGSRRMTVISQYEALRDVVATGLTEYLDDKALTAIGYIMRDDKKGGSEFYNVLISSKASLTDKRNALKGAFKKGAKLYKVERYKRLDDFPKEDPSKHSNN